MVLRSQILAHKLELPSAEQALPGRAARMAVPAAHYVNGNPLRGPFPTDLQQAVFALGCFWGAERRFWQQPGVWSSAVGYAGGHTPNPTYEEVCSGLTGHTEVVLVVFDPQLTTYEQLLKVFWEAHNPTQGMRQGNDIGTQYRSAIYCMDDAQLQAALASQAQFQLELEKAGFGAITTEIAAAPPFYYAEAYHQQYLAKNPGGYCGLGGTGVCLPG
ncbi:peptide-methionine (S)-S-oxide reductase MsrA [Pseudomonas sp. WS 5013]|uniref:peptide-methionine (S)-S-oxide reductase MsrA n=1 Tax=Pseudomonas sp. WS 5013 TaxID=2717475 RepID=UPI0014733DF6|nr:peptide-methionine (S)-S-oxide reductase MsrA [Pseudomonas sp. WS 5013]NMY41841.1 peptide-methionine (S)-S-oxide reductase MsrA [Pseudomonas sp. WS 5013]